MNASTFDVSGYVLSEDTLIVYTGR
jgi:hypothetical protein